MPYTWQNNRFLRRFECLEDSLVTRLMKIIVILWERRKSIVDMFDEISNQISDAFAFREKMRKCCVSFAEI